MCKYGKNDSEKQYDILISMLNLYQNEWMHRDKLFWEHAFKLFYASLIVTLIPFLTEHLYLKIDLFPLLIYPIVGMFIALLFLFLFVADSKRSEAAYKSYLNVMNKLPAHLHRIKIEDLSEKRGLKLVRRRTGVTICSFMFVGLFTLEIIEIIILLSGNK